MLQEVCDHNPNRCIHNYEHESYYKKGPKQIKIKKLDHVSIATDCLEETKVFYCELLGLKVGYRPKLKSSGYWLYSGDDAIIHLVETNKKLMDGGKATASGKETLAPWGKAKPNDMVETGMDDHIAMTVEKSAGLVECMKENGVAYWDRLLADRALYQIFIRDPNGVIIELNDYTPEMDKIDPMTIIQR